MYIAETSPQNTDIIPNVRHTGKPAERVKVGAQFAEVNAPDSIRSLPQWCVYFCALRYEEWAVTRSVDEMSTYKNLASSMSLSRRMESWHTSSSFFVTQPHFMPRFRVPHSAKSIYDEASSSPIVSNIGILRKCRS